MNDFYSEHETPAFDTPEDVAKALRFVWIPYRGHWLEMSNLTQFEKGGTYNRSDNVMQLCEMKFYNAVFTIDKSYYLNLKNKIAALQQHTRTRKNIFVTLITSYVIKENEYSKDLVYSHLEMDVLFVD